MRLETKAFLASLQHRPCRADLGLADGASGLDIYDDAEPHADQIVVGIGKEGRPLESAGPLSGWIRWRDELRYDLSRCAEGGVVEHCEILLHRTPGFLLVPVSVPISACALPLP